MAVLNKHKLPGKTIPPDAIYIGRGSKWGNPFVIGEHGTRDQVCNMYAEHMDNRIRQGTLTLQELAELHGKDLVCFCAPARCHGHYLKRKAFEAYKELNQ